MPPQVSQSAVLAKIAQQGRVAHEKHKNDETRYGFVNLPEGIVGGVAQLVMVKVGEYKPTAKTYPGKPFVTFQGIIQAPAEAMDPATKSMRRILGQRASITIPLCDTPDRKKKDGSREPALFEDNYADLLNELQKFGIDTSTTTFDNLELIFKGLEMSKPYFNFSTNGYTPPATPAKPNPTRMVFTQFDGICEYHPVNDPAAGFTETAPATSANGDASHMSPPSATGGPVNVDGAEDYEGLASLADQGDQDAGVRICELANGLGFDDAAIQAAGSTYADLAVAMRAKENKSNPTQTAWVAKAGDVCNFTPSIRGPGGKINKGKPVQCKVDSVVGEKANLTNLTDPKKTYVAPLSELEKV